MLQGDYGRPCARDDDFKARARQHQSRFRVEVLGLCGCRGVGSRLTADAALAGRNFYPSPGVLESVEQRFGFADKKLCADMLASDHIPFNFFVPLRDQAWTLDLLRGWVGQNAARITGVHIGWAPEPARSFLDGQTSFDAYITYDTVDGKRGAVGIETSFAEGPCNWSATEKRFMFDDASSYLRVMRGSTLYVDGALDSLRTKPLKRLWRSQLLAETIVRCGARDEATTILLYPSGNAHCSSAARAYGHLLQPKRRAQFLAVTFEDYLAQCRAVCRGAAAAAWLDYLELRYLVTPTPVFSQPSWAPSR